MSNRRRIPEALVGLALIVALAVPAGGASASELEERADKFIRSLAGQAIESLTKKGTSREVRIQRFRELFNENFAVRSIGKFVLGRHWRKATDAEKTEYMGLFEDLMVISYVDTFQRYAGENLSVTRTRPDKAKIVTVFTDIVRPGATKPAKVLWRVGDSGDSLKILDVIVEGISLGQTLRADFGSIIRRKQGRVAGLIKELRLKTASLKQSSAN